MSELKPCQACNNTGWVCEAHPDKPMDHGCGIGMPCEWCNGGSTYDKPPETSKVFESVTRVKGKVIN